MKTTKINKIQETFLKTIKELILSFKEKKIIWAFVYDVCFILIAGIILKTASKLLLQRMNALGILQAKTPEMLVQNMGVMQQFMYTTIITAIILYLVLLVIYTISRGLIWAKIMNLKPTKKYFLKFGLLSLVWITGWLLAFTLLVTITNQQYYKWIMIIMGIAYIHLTTVLHHAFSYKNEIGTAVQKAFSTGIGRIHQLIFPYIYIIIIFILTEQILTRTMQIPVSIQVMQIIGIALILLFLAWHKTYLNKAIIKLEK